MVDERKQDVQAEVIRCLGLLTNIAAAVRNRVYSLGRRSVRGKGCILNTNLSQEFDETLEHIIAVGVTIIVNI